MLKKFFPLIIFLLFLLPLQAGAVQNVIGVRVVKNAGDLTSYPHTYVNGILSPLEWYEKNVGTKGNPEALEVDGYPAIKDGRTIYVASTNIVAGKIFSNIYLISYNEGAEPEVLQILAQLTSNWKFNINIDTESIESGLPNDNIRV
ncbi:MAG: hypothetical protein KKC68_02695, partial [Candidatus Thermoplasmatota archaeon]|nr:hypothetical protein [Candidatus Thermoplasmatota archaeon]